MARTMIKIDETKREVTITMSMEDDGTLSSTGKMNLIACSHGNQQTDAEYKGKSVYANVTIGTFAIAKK